MSVITFGEMQKGFELTAQRDPSGARTLEEWLALVRKDQAARILPISDEVALARGRLEARRPRAVHGLIAATAIVHGLTLVTPNVQDFDALSISILNPWSP